MGCISLDFKVVERQLNGFMGSWAGVGTPVGRQSAQTHRSSPIAVRGSAFQMDWKPTKRQLRFASRSPFAAPEMWLMTGIPSMRYVRLMRFNFPGAIARRGLSGSSGGRGCGAFRGRITRQPSYSIGRCATYDLHNRLQFASSQIIRRFRRLSGI